MASYAWLWILCCPSYLYWETFAFLPSGKSHRDGCTEYEQLVCSHIGLDEQGFQSKIVNIFLPISLTCVLGAQRNLLIETVLLSTHNICFG